MLTLVAMEVAGDEAVTQLYRRRYIRSEIAEYVSLSELRVICRSPKTQTQPPEGSAWPRWPNSIERDE